MDVSSRAGNGSDEECGLLQACTSRLISPDQAAEAVSPAYSNSDTKSTADWLVAITRLVTRGRTDTQELAILVHDAKRKLRRGQWTELWRARGIPFSKRKGEMLAAIGKGLGALNAQTFSHLPAGWSILYQLSKLNLETLQRHINDGRIHPDLTLAEAKKLVAIFKGPNSAQSGPPKIKQRLHRFVEFVRKTMDEWSPEDRKLTHTALTNLLDEITSHQNDAPNAQTFAHLPNPLLGDDDLSARLTSQTL